MQSDDDFYILQQPFQICMGFLKQIGRLIKINDFFFSAQMLRYEDDEKYRTLTGGILSLGIIITIIIGFASMILDTLQLSSITTKLEVIKQTDPTHSVLSTSPDSMFMFGVEIWLLNLSDSVRYFDLNFKSVLQSGQQTLNTTYIPLEACTKEHWAQFPDILQNFQKLQMGGWLCPKINQTFQLFGKYSSDIYNQYTITLSACTNDTNAVPCAPQSQIDQLYADNADFFYFTFYFTNPVINSGSKDYKKYYLQDKNYVIFGKDIGSETYVYFTDYTIKTDYSIWPFSDINTDSGCIVEDLAVNHPFQVSNGDIVTLNFAKSANSLVYTRTVQKLSSIFSFMGGMIGAISTLLLIIHMYTRVSFQISIAFSIFKPPLDKSQVQQPAPQTSMNMWTFIKLEVMSICKNLGVKLNCPSMVYIEECRSQIMRQLDVKALIKRLIFIQYCLTFLFEDYQLKGLQLKKPTSTKQIRQIREKCESVSMDEEPVGSQEEGSNKDDKGQMSDSILMPSIKQPQTLMKSQAPIKYSKFTNIKPGKRKLYNFQRREGMIEEKGKDFSQNKISSILKVESLSRQHGNEQIKQQYNEKQKNRNESYLQYLQITAEGGDAMSKKILSNLLKARKQQNKKEVDSAYPFQRRQF